MDLSKYIDIEEGMSSRLMRSWRTPATRLYSKMLKSVEKADFDGARQLASDIDLTDVAEKNRRMIHTYLYAAAAFGMRVAAGGKKPLAQVGRYDTTMNRVTDLVCRSVEWNATVYTLNAAMQSIARAEEAYKKEENETVKKAAAKRRFVREFVSFQDDGDDMLQLVSSLHTSRLATWGFTAEAEVLGVETYKLQAVLDGRTSEFCKLIHGKTFKVSDARRTVVEVLGIDNPDDAKQIQPWPRQSKAQISQYKGMSAEQLTALNLHIPPFHPGCRTLCTRVDVQYTVSTPPKPKNAVEFIDSPLSSGMFTSTGNLVPELSKSSGENLLLKKVLEIYGGTQLPKVVSAKALDKLIEANGLEMFRGTSGFLKVKGSDLMEKFVAGEYYVGRGIFGDGTYTATTKDGVAGLTTAKHYSDGTTGSISRMTMAADAKIGDYHDLMDQARKDFGDGFDILEKRVNDTIAKIKADKSLSFDAALAQIDEAKAILTKFEEIHTNVSIYATIRGYHAYVIKENGYVVVLDRSKVVVEQLGRFP